MSFKVAASLALKDAALKCSPVLLEPVMKVVAEAPNEYLGNIIGGITSRRGKINSQDNNGKYIKVSAYVPLSEMFGYVTVLRSDTQGRGTYVMEFDHYDVVPKSIADEVIKGK